ncbi:MAG: Protoporphyrinogen oxidase [Chlamydiae bacterium]|nr:Protoporphyrinogen oxidase [Chlamydiota bacterium]
MKVAVLGGGISGLSAAYFAQQKGAEVTLFEKEERLGGWMNSATDPFFFERGPRTFKTSRSLELLDLILDLGLKDELIVSDENAKVRFLYLEGKLQRFPKPLFSWAIIKGLLREWRVAPFPGDESIGEFATRRFNRAVADRIFDPLALGVFAGDIYKLSIESCFPFFKQLEREYGSVIKGMIKQKKKKKRLPIQGELFSLKGGTKALVDALASRIARHQRADVISLKEGMVETTQGSEQFDQVICALPPKQLPRLLPITMEEIEMRSVDILQLGFKRDLLPVKGFGYLVPTCEGKQVMGCIFDSSIFPQQNRSKEETRLTVMVRPNQNTMEAILKELKEQIGVTAKPDFCALHHLHEAIPQYNVGHRERIATLKEQLPPWCLLAGNYLTGASVNACVVSGKKAANSLQLPVSTP